MKCLIVDDDKMARVSLETMCNKVEDLVIVKSCESGVEAIQLLNNEEVDLIFLDIEMPDLSGIDIVRTVRDLPQVVFITSRKEYALEAFDFQVADYLTKPLQFPRFVKALERVRKLRSLKSVAKDTLDEIFVKVDGKLIRLPLNDIIYVESIGDYVIFHTEKKEKFIVHSTLKNIDEKITDKRFLKIHRSYIVNLTKIVDIEEGNLVVRDKVLPVSRAHRPVLMRHIKTI